MFLGRDTFQIFPSLPQGLAEAGYCTFVMVPICIIVLAYNHMGMEDFID